VKTLHLSIKNLEGSSPRSGMRSFYPILSFVVIATFSFLLLGLCNNAYGYDNGPKVLMITLENPSAIAVNPNTNTTYATSGGSDFLVTNSTTPKYLYVINGSTNHVTKIISAGSYPSSIAVNPKTNKVYVRDDTVGIEVIDGKTNTLVDTINVGSSKITLNPETDTIYAVTGKGTVLAIDGASNKILSNITLDNGEPYYITVNPNTNKVLVTEYRSQILYVIDGSTNKIINKVPLDSSPNYIAVNPETNMIYLPNSNGELKVINGSNYKLVTTITGFNEGIVFLVAVNPKTNTIYAGEDGVDIIDGFSNRIIKKISTGANEVGLTVNPITNITYVAVYGSKEQNIAQGGVARQIFPKIPTHFLSPLQQVKAGIDPFIVECNDDLTLVIKWENLSPACVEKSTVSKLTMIDWMLHPQSPLPVENLTNQELADMTVTRINDNNNTGKIDYSLFTVVDSKVIASYPLLQKALKAEDKQLEYYNIMCERTVACRVTIPMPGFTSNYNTQIPAGLAQAMIADPALAFHTSQDLPPNVKSSFMKVNGIMYIINLTTKE